MANNPNQFGDKTQGQGGQQQNPNQPSPDHGSQNPGQEQQPAQGERNAPSDDDRTMGRDDTHRGQTGQNWDKQGEKDDTE